MSDRVHDRYQRQPLDLPWRGWVVRLVITVRRFRCRNRACSRRTFAEEFPETLPRRARRTAAATELLLTLACTAGGEAGARLAAAMGLPTSPDTLLRLLRRTAAPGGPTPRVLGVDDLALRRRQHYATLLINLETHEPVDLLNGREAETLATWLRAHPGVEIVVRDRAEAYAEGARAGAPNAQQVADRFHLLQNASLALDELLRNRRRQITLAVMEPPSPQPDHATPAKPLSPRQQHLAARRAARIARWEEVQRFHAAGRSLRGIARDLGINRRTVRQLLATAEPPRNQITRPRPSGVSSPSLQPYVRYLQDRWQAGCSNISQLRREIAAQGYQGSRSLLYQALKAWRPPRPPPEAARRVRRLSVRWLCLRPPDQLKPDEQVALQQVLTADRELATGYDLLQRFRQLLAARAVAALDAWLKAAQASNLPTFLSLAHGIVADRAAVEAALTLPWSNGATEGHVHRVKLIKRQGYGRAKFDLLRRRVLAA